MSPVSESYEFATQMNFQHLNSRNACSSGSSFCCQSKTETEGGFKIDLLFIYKNMYGERENG